ncbi:hypothetical protein LV716_14570 [Flagellimonas sp. HMM57]|uniref:hypothetical protein n=1 Tax=unclassified Flagellimonas TaxID=2644544 RepID=UPI0013D86A9E|nr:MULTISPECIES: hypothetical protein [unclassified Flagellimonas]UII75472.1 hypothetical protein LV716_14570 [Flagellimonas sp. HMM57]
MKKLYGCFAFSIFILIGCNSNDKNESLQIGIVNDVFLELVGDIHKYQTYEDFEKEYYMKTTDSLTYEQLYSKYNNQDKKFLANGKILLDNHLKKLDSNDIEQLYVGDLYDEFIVGNQTSIEFDINQITKKGNYEVLNGSSNNIEVGNGVSRVGFSRAYFNYAGDKAILFFEIFCGEYCYKKKIVTVKKHAGSGKWVIIDRNTLEVA